MNKNYFTEKILLIHHWSKKLFSFKSTRNKSFKFLNGEFIIIGVKKENKIITRAYSLVSSNFNNYLEFLSIKIKIGEFTSIIKNIKINDYIYLGKKSSGTLIIKNLKNKKLLWLVSSGTGLSPFISIVKDFNIYEKYNIVILIQSTKYMSELCYKFYINKTLFLKKIMNNYKNKLIYYYILTRNKYYKVNERITNLLKNYKIFKDLKIYKLKIKRDEFMLCGSMNMLKEIVKIFDNYKFIKKNKNINFYLIEKSFVN